MTGADSLRDPTIYKTVFPIRSAYTIEAEPTIRYLWINHGTVAVVFRDDAYGRPLVQWLRGRSKSESGFHIVAEIPYDRLTSNVAQQVQENLAAKANVLFTFCNPRICKKLVEGVLLAAKHQPLIHKRPILIQNSLVDPREQFNALGRWLGSSRLSPNRLQNSAGDPEFSRGQADGLQSRLRRAEAEAGRCAPEDCDGPKNNPGHYAIGQPSEHQRGAFCRRFGENQDDPALTVNNVLISFRGT